MIKSTPSSNLLTVADSPFQHHLVSLIIYLYIYKQIQMLLDSPPAPSSRLRFFVAMVLDANSPHLTEESLDYKTVRSDRFVSTLCRPNLATWRHKVSHEAMHSHDGSYRNQPVVQYIGPVQEDGKLIVKRKTGNKVVMDIEYDPLRRRPKSLKTTLAEGQTEQNVSYTYDKKGNISSITDRLNESRSQTFQYDTLNRVTKAIGKYGTEDYSYHKNGNLLQRGQFALQYNNPNHVHAVTKVSSLQTGDTTYTYDTTGNLIERNGDVFRYNSQNKLTEITTAGGDVFQYFYDASGNRIKKQLKNANTTTYNFSNLYEIHRSPGEPEKHTMYIPGIEGDKVAQYTRSDALLVQAGIEGYCIPESKCLPCGDSLQNICSNLATQGKHGDIFDQRINFLEAKTLFTSLFREIETDIALVLFNIPKHQLYTDNYQMLPSMRVLIWLLAFGILIYYALTINTQDAFATRRLRLATSFALFPFFFATSAGCSPLFFGGAQGEEGTPPWLLIAAVPANTPSVSDEPTFFGGGSGTGATTTNSSRITGMYFYHPDHLGSITMITDGRGNVLAGGERGGKSHITYRPYGEILRTDSFGPDISKYKYTGQEEDRESGLYFYDSRYYDSRIGRFISNDTEVDALEPNGMNRMMYVNGDPISFRDPSGNVCEANVFSALAITSMRPGIGPAVAAGGGVVGNHTGGGKCSKLPIEETALYLLLLPHIDRIQDGGHKNVALFATYLYASSLSGKGPSPLGKLSRTELQILLLAQPDYDDKTIISLMIYTIMTTGVLNSKTGVDRASFFHDQYGPNIMRERNRRANSKWMGQAKTASFSHDSWSKTYKREWDATKRSCRDARDLCGTVNTIGTVVGNAVTTIVGSTIFSIANAISGTGTWMHKNKLYYKKGGKIF